MKNWKILLFILFAGLLASCSAGTAPGDDVGLSAAFAHCATLTSYWVWGIIVTLIVAFAIYFMIKNYQKTGSFSALLMFVLLAALLFVWFYRPSELAWNTTVEQAARGVWIGF